MKQGRKFRLGDAVVLTENVAMPYYGVAILAGERGTSIDVDPESPDDLVIAMQRRIACLTSCRNMIGAKAAGVKLSA
jgi:hypothetical protein